MEAETKAADDGRPLRRRTTSTTGAAGQWPRTNMVREHHRASSRYMSFGFGLKNGPKKSKIAISSHF